MAELRRPTRIWERRRGRRRLSRNYLLYLRSLTRMTDDERTAFREIGVNLTNARIARIEDFYGASTFIEGTNAS